MVAAEQDRVPRLPVVRRPRERRAPGAGGQHPGHDRRADVGEVDQRDQHRVGVAHREEPRPQAGAHARVPVVGDDDLDGQVREQQPGLLGRRPEHHVHRLAAAVERACAERRNQDVPSASCTRALGVPIRRPAPAASRSPAVVMGPR